MLAHKGLTLAEVIALTVVAALLLFFGHAFSWVFAVFGLVVSSPEAASSVGFIVVFPLTFISSAFVPVESMPEGLRWFAEINPFTYMVDAMRALWLGAPAGLLVGNWIGRRRGKTRTPEALPYWLSGAIIGGFAAFVLGVMTW